MLNHNQNSLFARAISEMSQQKECFLDHHWRTFILFLETYFFILIYFSYLFLNCEIVFVSCEFFLCLKGPA